MGCFSRPLLPQLQYLDFVKAYHPPLEYPSTQLPSDDNQNIPSLHTFSIGFNSHFGSVNEEGFN